MASSDYLLELDGIKGESAQKGFEGQIEIQSWSFGVTQLGSSSQGTGAGSGKASFQDIHFTTSASKASPNLFMACATGKHIPKAVLHMRKAGGKQEEYYTVTLTDVLVSSFQLGGHDSAGALPTDQFAFNFSKIELAYKSQKADGSLDAAIKAGYDLKKGTKV